MTMTHMQPPHGAGVIMICFSHGQPEVLLVKGASSQKWSFPKGRVEPHETRWQQTALRELKEESTLELSRDQLSHSPFLIESVGHQSGQWTRSRNVYFLSRVASKPLVDWNRVDSDEISALQWFPLHHCPLATSNRDVRMFLEPTMRTRYVPGTIEDLPSRPRQSSCRKPHGTTWKRTSHRHWRSSSSNIWRT